MSVKGSLVFAAMLAASVSASAAVVTLTFEGVGNNAQVLNYYNGGTSSIGTSGTNYGISFTNNAFTYTNGNFSNQPSAPTVMVLQSFQGSNPTAYFNYAAGFTTGFSFFYSSSTAASVNIYDGLDGTGAILGSISLTAQSQGSPGGPGCNDTDFCNWTSIGTAFAGTAKSVGFSGALNRTGFDNLTFGCATSGGCTTAGVPEPTSLALAGLALVGLGLSRRRYAAAAAN